MARTVTLNALPYDIPDVGDAGLWQVVSDWIVAASTDLLQKTGGTFTLSADVDFGASFGLISSYFTSRTTHAATTGPIRLANNEGVGWRNAANSANKILKVNASDALEYDGTVLQPLTTDGDIIVRSGGQNVRLPKGADGTVLKMASGAVGWGTVTGSGDVVGPGSSVDNTLPRFDSTSGKVIQASGVVVSDNNEMSAFQWLRAAKAASGSTSGAHIIGVTSTAAPRTITLSDTDKLAGRIVVVKDESGGAQTNNITVTPQTGTIDGAASYTIATNYGSVTLFSDGSNWFTLREATVVNYSVDAWTVTGTLPFVSVTGNPQNGSPVVVSISSTANLYKGMCAYDATGGLFPHGARILSVDSASQVTLTKNATGSASSSSLRFGYNCSSVSNGGVLKSGAGKLYGVLGTHTDSSYPLVVGVWDTATMVDPSALPSTLLVAANIPSFGTAGPMMPHLFGMYGDGIPFTTGLAYSVFTNFWPTTAAMDCQGLKGALTILYA